MKLEPIVQSEVSQKDKEHYSILTHIYGIQKDGNDNPICKTEKETQMYRADFWGQFRKPINISGEQIKDPKKGNC